MKRGSPVEHTSKSVIISKRWKKILDKYKVFVFSSFGAFLTNYLLEMSSRIQSLEVKQRRS